MLQQLVDANYGCGSALEEVDDPADSDDGPDELHHVDVEAGELANGNAMENDLVASDEQRDHQRETEDELKRGPEHGHQTNQMQAAADVFAIGLFEGGDLRFLLGEGANQAGAGEVLLSLGGDVGEHRLNAFEAAVNPVSEVLNDHRSRGKGNEGEEGQLGADAIHEGQRGTGEDQRVGAVHDRRAEQLAHGVQIVGGAGHDVAGAVGVIVAGRLPFEIGEKIVAQVELDFARCPDDDLAGDVKKDGRTCRDQQQTQTVEENLLLRDAVTHVIDGVPDDDGDQNA